MSRLSSQQKRRLTRLWQAAADGLAAGSPVEIEIGIVGDDTTVFRSDMWTSALTRQSLYYWWSIDAVKRAIGSKYKDLTAEEAALPIVRELIGPTILIQQKRWMIAEALGLVRDGQPIDLPSGEMMIDKTLLAMLDVNDIDVRRAGTLVKFDEEDFPVGDELPKLMIGANFRGRKFFVRQEEMGHPVICTWLPVGSARYDGTMLALSEVLPEGIVNRR